MTDPNLYVVQCEVDGDYTPEFERWYADRHGPDLVSSGFHSAQMLRCVDVENTYLTVYDAPEHNVFTSDVYSRARAADPNLAIAESHIGAMTKGRFAHWIVAGEQPPAYPVVDSAFVTTVRAEVADADRAAYTKWVSETLAPAARAAGATRVWDSQLASLHNLFPHLVPHNTLVVIEWAARPAELIDALGLGGAPESVEALTFERFYRQAV